MRQVAVQNNDRKRQVLLYLIFVCFFVKLGIIYAKLSANWEIETYLLPGPASIRRLEHVHIFCNGFVHVTRGEYQPHS